MARFSLHLNGRPVAVEAEADHSLLQALQGQLALHATRAGCGMGLCGACTVLVARQAVRACSVHLDELSGQPVRTVEGLQGADPAHPVLGAWRAAGLPEPGACLCPSGRIMALTGLWERGALSERAAEVLAEESICECGRDKAVGKVARRLLGGD